MKLDEIYLSTSVISKQGGPSEKLWSTNPLI
jgi:hypothetical protein